MQIDGQRFYSWKSLGVFSASKYADKESYVLKNGTSWQLNEQAFSVLCGQFMQVNDNGNFVTFLFSAEVPVAASGAGM